MIIKKLYNIVHIKTAVATAFGNEIIENNVINKKKLAEIVFNNPDKLLILNKIIHPEVRKHFLKWLEKHQKNPIVIKEAAILFESGSYNDCDFVITVTAPLEDRINRVIKRDRVSRDEVLSRIKNQWTDEQRISKSNFIIDNTGLDTIKQQIEIILNKISI